MEKNKLKNCPFCGSEAKEVFMGNTSCSNFDCRLFNVYFVADDWNTRPQQTVPLDEESIINMFYGPSANGYVFKKVITCKEDAEYFSKELCQRFHASNTVPLDEEKFR